MLYPSYLVPTISDAVVPTLQYQDYHEFAAQYMFGLQLIDYYMDRQINIPREVVVAQLVERWLPIPEVRGSNPVIGKNLLILNICILSTVY